MRKNPSNLPIPGTFFKSVFLIVALLALLIELKRRELLQPSFHLQIAFNSQKVINTKVIPQPVRDRVESYFVFNDDKLET